MKKLFSLLMAALLAVGLVPAMAETAVETAVCTAAVTEIQKYGNMLLDVKGSDLLAAGFAYGDLVTVTILGTDYDMPIGSNYSDVDQGSMICRVVVKEDAEAPEDYALLAINMGDLATTAGVATKSATEEAPGYLWTLNEGVEEPVTVTITLKEAGAFYDRWMMNQLVRSENREDYPDLTDEEFANFRAITTTGVAAGRLYRSSSPVNPEIGRNTYADAAAAAAGIKTFVNLADNAETMQAYEGFAESYYSGQNIIGLNLGVDFAAADFGEGLANGFRFIASHEGPYLVHCTEGKDRAGFTAAILECLMGADADEVTADYMVTYFNYYGVEPGTEQYDVIAGANIRKSLATAFGVESIEGQDLAALAESYLQSIGLSADEIAALKAALGE